MGMIPTTIQRLTYPLPLLRFDSVIPSSTGYSLDQIQTIQTVPKIQQSISEASKFMIITFVHQSFR